MRVMNILLRVRNITYMQREINNINIKKIGERVRKLRKDLNYSVNQAAMKYGGVTIATWSRIENGICNNVDFSTLIAISKALEITVDVLLKDIDFDYTIQED